MRSTSIAVMSCAALVATAGIASAQVQVDAPSYDTKTATSAQDFNTTQVERVGGQIVNFDLAGIESWDLQGSPNNTVIELDVADALGFASGTDLIMNGVGWKEVTIATNGASWLSEAGIYFDDNVNPDGMGLFLNVGAGDDFAGTGTYDSGGVLKLADAEIPDIPLPGGILRIEFFESFDDVEGAVDAVFQSGSLNIQIIPAPGAAAVLALGGLVATRRRR